MTDGGTDVKCNISSFARYALIIENKYVCERQRERERRGTAECGKGILHEHILLFQACEREVCVPSSATLVCGEKQANSEQKKEAREMAMTQNGKKKQN